MVEQNRETQSRSDSRVERTAAGQAKLSSIQEHLLFFCVFLQNLFFSLARRRCMGGCTVEGHSLVRETSRTIPSQLRWPPPSGLRVQEPKGRSAAPAHPRGPRC